jgi:hypothetical protein
MALITETVMSPGMSGRWSPKDEGNRLLQDIDNHLSDIGQDHNLNSHCYENLKYHGWRQQIALKSWNLFIKLYFDLKI